RRVQAGLVRERGEADVGLVGAGGDVGDLADRVADPAHLSQAPFGQDDLALLQLEPGDDTEQVGVPGPLAVPVGAALHVGHAGVHGDEAVRYRTGGVVMAVDA